MVSSVLAMKIDRAELFASGLGSAALDYDIAYHRPLRSGTAVEIRSGFVKVDQWRTLGAHATLTRGSMIAYPMSIRMKITM